MTIRRIRADEGLRLRAIRLAAIADAPMAFGETLDGARVPGEAEYAARARASSSGCQGC